MSVESSAPSAGGVGSSSSSSSPSLIRFSAPPTHPPSAYFAIVGRTFASYVTSPSLTLGRNRIDAGSSIPNSPSLTMSLGEDKTISRSHFRIIWSQRRRRWRMKVSGKNGVWYGKEKIAQGENEENKTPNDGGDEEEEEDPTGPPPPGTLLLSSRRASQLRIGLGDEACIFYFVPCLRPEDVPKRKRKKADGGGAVEVDDADGKKKRKKSESIMTTPSTNTITSSNSTILASSLTNTVDLTQMTPSPVDFDEAMPLSLLVNK